MDKCANSEAQYETHDLPFTIVSDHIFAERIYPGTCYTSCYAQWHYLTASDINHMTI